MKRHQIVCEGVSMDVAFARGATDANPAPANVVRYGKKRLEVCVQKSLLMWKLYCQSACLEIRGKTVGKSPVWINPEKSFVYELVQ